MANMQQLDIMQMFTSNDNSNNNDNNNNSSSDNKANNARKKKTRKRSLAEMKEEDDDEEYKPSSTQTKKRRKTSVAKSRSTDKKKPKPKKTPKRRGVIPGFCSYETKKDIGDALKNKMRLEKWTIPAQCLKVKMDLVAFRHLFEQHGKIKPANFDENTECVVCRLDGDASGEVFGKTKCKGGSMYGTYTICKMDIVFFPKERKARIWFAVSEW